MGEWRRKDLGESCIGFSDLLDTLTAYGSVISPNFVSGLHNEVLGLTNGLFSQICALFLKNILKLSILNREIFTSILFSWRDYGLKSQK
jgi:hypothetical protein